MKIQLENHGTIVLARPLDDEAREWLLRTAPEDAQFWGEALVIEPRFVGGVVEAFTADGGEVAL